MHDASPQTANSELPSRAHEAGAISDRRELGVDADVERAVKRLALNALLSSIDHYIWWKDPDGRFLGCNLAFARKHGFGSAQELVGLTDYDIPLFDGMADAFRADDASVAATRVPITNRETSAEHPEADDHTRYSKVPLIDEHDHVVGILGISTDITDRVAMERRLAADRNLLDQILANIPYQIAWKDSEGRYLGANRSYRTMIGLGEEQPIEGLRTDELPGSPPEGRAEAEAADQEVISSGIDSLHHPLTVTGDDGRTRQLEVSRVGLKSSNGDVTDLLTIYADHTEKFELQRKLDDASKMEAIGQLAAGVAHEINTPIQYVGDNLNFLETTSREVGQLLSSAASLAAKVLSGVDSTAEAEAMLADFDKADLEFLNEEVPRAVEQSLEGVARVRKIVQALKEFAHPGKEEPEPTDLNRVIESTISVATNEWKYVADVDVELDPDLPLAECQAGQLGQVVLILVVNAAHAIAERYGDGGPKGRITIRSVAQAGRVDISVDDDGGGIPDDVLPNIFQPFFTTKEVGRGSGQGLSLAHNIICRDHGGTLTVDTAPGRGTTFTISIPTVSNPRNSAVDGD